MADQSIDFAISFSLGDLSAEAKEPAWVKKMHEHFNRTGSYRASDLERVLGDPRKSVEIKAQDQLQTAGFMPKP